MPTIRQREADILRKFIAVFCRKRHAADHHLCSNCSDLLQYALERLERCPYDPKPICRRCPTHCYPPARRAEMREIMRFSGLYFIRRGRLDWLVKYFLLNRQLAKSELNIRSKKTASRTAASPISTQI